MLNAKILLDQAWGIYKKRFKVFLGIMTLPIFVLLPIFVAFLILIMILLHFDSMSILALFVSPLGLGLMSTLTLVSFISHFWSQIALLYAIKDREENVGIKESYRRGWGKIISYFWISLLFGFIITGGTIFFFIPGLIFFVWFSLASFVLISDNKKGWQALLTSKEYVKGNWWSVFWRFLFIGTITWLFFHLINVLSVLINVLVIGDILFCVGYLLIVPLVTIYLFLIYENLKRVKAGKLVY